MTASMTKTPPPAAATPRIVAAKLRVPVPRETLIPRQHLRDRLRQGRGRRLTLLSAPAGYGKSTLLAQWASEDRLGTPFVWVSLDTGDADPVRLWSHVIRGFQAVHPPVGDTSLGQLRRWTRRGRPGCRPDTRRGARERARARPRPRGLACVLEPGERRGPRPLRLTGPARGAGGGYDARGPAASARPATRTRRARWRYVPTNFA